MDVVNCWEYKKCGKENVCPAGLFKEADGYLGGKNGGRACVYIAGTFCPETIRGTYKDKKKYCFACDFYKLLKKKYGKEFSVLAFHRYVKKNKKVEIISV